MSTWAFVNKSYRTPKPTFYFTYFDTRIVWMDFCVYWYESKKTNSQISSKGRWKHMEKTSDWMIPHCTTASFTFWCWYINIHKEPGKHARGKILIIFSGLFFFYFEVGLRFIRKYLNRMGKVNQSYGCWVIKMQKHSSMGRWLIFTLTTHSIYPIFGVVNIELKWLLHRIDIIKWKER